MAITSLADLAAAKRTQAAFYRTSGGNSFTNFTLYNTINYGTLPAAGAAGPSNTANGVVPTNSTSGMLGLPSTPDKLYLVNAECTWIGGTAGIVKATLFDMLFYCGSYNSVATTNLTSQPSFSSRLPNSSYVGTQLWMEATSGIAGAGYYTATITYTDQSANAGHTTSVTMTGNTNTWPGGMTRVPLASGDSGISLIQTIQITATSATAGNGVNFMIVRPIASFFMPTKSKTVAQPLEVIGFPEVHPNSALFLAMGYGTAATNTVVSLELDFASG